MPFGWTALVVVVVVVVVVVRISGDVASRACTKQG